MIDDTEELRRAIIASGHPEQALANAKKRWNSEELSRDFIVHGFMAPYVVVTRKSDNLEGTLEFTHSPRFYFNFISGSG